MSAGTNSGGMSPWTTPLSFETYGAESAELRPPRSIIQSWPRQISYERKIECPDYQRGFCKLGPDCPRKHVRRVACQLYLSGFCPDGPDCKRGHPKPDIPPPEAYRPPSPPSQRDLGPPPPGYGRFEHGGQGGPGGGFVVGANNPGFVPRRNLDEVLCFKCGQKGHYANTCRNKNVPGNRGGQERVTTIFEMPSSTQISRRISSGVLESRIKGCLWGSAAGDAMGCPYEFKSRGTYTPTENVEICRTFSYKGQPLPRGSWTDDTSMQLCLAVSLAATGGELDWVDVARRWTSWWKQGYLSSVTGYCFDIGMATRSALATYVKLLDPDCPRPTHTPNMNPQVVNSGNGSLMRLSPVPAALHQDPMKAIETASLQSKVTHSSPLCVDACVLATAYMIGFYHAKGNARERKQAILNPLFTPFADGSPIPLTTQEVRGIHSLGLYKNRTASDVRTDGFVISTFEAALWALWKGSTFEEGLMLLLPLGDDVDTVCAVYGQLAGATYGFEEIPMRWVEALQHPDILSDAYAGVVALGIRP
ncbi:ADP-ribosylglycohydrolase [Ceratobasidium sp. AG-Ba]|nr:ADP-ribosylglycohydrolase [Ceratobasidium sp. AG-Ba]